jgi:hypothetical protein
MARWDSEGKTGPPGTFTAQLHQKHGILCSDLENSYDGWKAGRNDYWRQRSALEGYVSEHPEHTLATTEAFARYARESKSIQPKFTEAQMSLMRNLVQSGPHLASFHSKPREVAFTRVHHCRVYSQTVSGPMPHALFLTMSTPMSRSHWKRRDLMLRGTRDQCTFHLGENMSIARSKIDACAHPLTLDNLSLVRWATATLIWCHKETSSKIDARHYYHKYPPQSSPEHFAIHRHCK